MHATCRRDHAYCWYGPTVDCRRVCHCCCCCCCGACWWWWFNCSAIPLTPFSANWAFVVGRWSWVFAILLQLVRWRCCKVRCNSRLPTCRRQLVRLLHTRSTNYHLLRPPLHWPTGVKLVYALLLLLLSQLFSIISLPLALSRSLALSLRRTPKCTHLIPRRPWCGAESAACFVGCLGAPYCCCFYCCHCGALFKCFLQLFTVVALRNVVVRMWMFWFVAATSSRFGR